MSVNSDGNSGSQPVIVNTVLAYMNHLILSRDKTFIIDKICSKFDLDTIKYARQVLFMFEDPNTPGYNGPNGRQSIRERQVHALGGIYSKLYTLDATKTPIFACPSNELLIY